MRIFFKKIFAKLQAHVERCTIKTLMTVYDITKCTRKLDLSEDKQILHLYSSFQ